MPGEGRKQEGDRGALPRGAEGKDPGGTRAPGVSIIGLGRSGRAAALLALREGEVVHVSDLATDAQARAHARELVELGAQVELGHHDVARIARAGTVIVSPGIPPDAPVLRALRERGVRWIGEPEYAVRFLPGTLIAVTGTNGKTTTTLLMAHLLREGGVHAEAGGNVGGGLAPAASELALQSPVPSCVVLEMSSFQLADTEDFAPAVGVVTSLAPDHLDRYPDVAAYWSDKARLFRNARPADHWILNGESEAVRDLPGEAPGTRLLFALDPEGAAPPPRTGEAGVAAWEEEGEFRLRLPGGPVESLGPVAALPFRGRHNRMNALAAALAARVAGASAEGIRRGLGTFPGLPHRMERVARGGGVEWVNDSKATNVAAAASALASLEVPVVALLGGKDKGEDFTPLAQALLGAKVRGVVFFGDAGARMEDEVTAVIDRSVTGVTAFPLVRVRTLEAAVREAGEQARSGDVVLLAPACSSFDAFRDYTARGDRFRELARVQAREAGR
jgi:UDP-N-acetylmuramoylalanine--D-glutamate ligase